MPFKKQYDDDILIEGSFRECCKESETRENKNGGKTTNNWVPHGFFRKVNDFGEIEFFGCFIDGRLQGKCWKSLAGGNLIFSRWQQK